MIKKWRNIIGSGCIKFFKKTSKKLLNDSKIGTKLSITTFFDPPFTTDIDPPG